MTCIEHEKENILFGIVPIFILYAQRVPLNSFNHDRCTASFVMSFLASFILEIELCTVASFVLEIELWIVASFILVIELCTVASFVLEIELLDCDNFLFSQRQSSWIVITVFYLRRYSSLIVTNCFLYQRQSSWIVTNCIHLKRESSWIVFFSHLNRAPGLWLLLS